MRYTKRRPDFAIRVVRPRYQAGRGFDDVGYFPSGRVGDNQTVWSDQLLSYSFSEQLASVGTDFTFAITPELDRNGKSWMDKIRPRDVAVFTEFGVVRYVGVIMRIRYTGRMDDTPNRSITISGMGIGGILSSFKLVLDQHVYQYNSTAQAENRKFITALQGALSVEDSFRQVMISAYQSFIRLMNAVGNLDSDGGVGVVLSRYLDYETGIDPDIKPQFPVHFNLYSAGANDIWSIWEGMVQRPIHELFGRWNAETDMYQIVFRQAPFNPEDWASLPIHEMDPLWVKSVEVGLSDDDIYTFFSSSLPGSGISREVSLGVGEYAQQAEVDREKWALYGYRPMEMMFKYFDRDYLADFTGADSLMGKMNRMVRQWYERNAEFLNGTVETMTVPDTYVRVGERLRYLNGEFYVEGTSRSWTYGGPMITNLTVTRGYKYDDSGEYIGPIRNLGTSLKRSEVMS